MKFAYALAGLAAGTIIAGGANAAVYTVEALTHSANGGAGTGLATLAFAAGDEFSLSADLDDLWSAGALPRWSNADGLTGDRFATGTDESGQAAGVQIGQDFGLLNIDGFAAPYGGLVGQIGAGPGSYRLLGTSFSGPAWASGTLVLYYWDTFTADNANSVDVTITAVPEPAAWAIMIAGFGLAGAALRRRRLAIA